MPIPPEIRSELRQLLLTIDAGASLSERILMAVNVPPENTVLMAQRAIMQCVIQAMLIVDVDDEVKTKTG